MLIYVLKYLEEMSQIQVNSSTKINKSENSYIKMGKKKKSSSTAFMMVLPSNTVLSAQVSTERNYLTYPFSPRRKGE